MIIPKPAHLFENCYPKLEEGEEEIFYQHPVYDLKCNQIGMVYPGESLTYFSYSVLPDKYNLNDMQNYKTSAPRLKVIAQCFAGSMDIPFRVVPFDGNPYNTTVNNLLYPKSFAKKAYENHYRFKENTLDYMLRKDKKLEARNISPIMYWGLQRIVHPYRTEYSNATGYNLSLDDNGIPKMAGVTGDGKKKKPVRKTGVRGKYRTKQEISALRVKVKGMVNSGIPKSEVAKQLNMTSSEVNYYYTSKDYVSKSWTKKS